MNIHLYIFIEMSPYIYGTRHNINLMMFFSFVISKYRYEQQKKKKDQQKKSNDCSSLLCFRVGEIDANNS